MLWNQEKVAPTAVGVAVVLAVVAEVGVEVQVECAETPLLWTCRRWSG